MLIYLKTCICGKVLPYETDSDKMFFDKYHSNCTDDMTALDTEGFY